MDAKAEQAIGWDGSRRGRNLQGGRPGRSRRARPRKDAASGDGREVSPLDFALSRCGPSFEARGHVRLSSNYFPTQLVAFSRVHTSRPVYSGSWTFLPWTRSISRAIASLP